MAQLSGVGQTKIKDGIKKCHLTHPGKRNEPL